MWYFGNPCSSELVHEAMLNPSKHLGMIITRNQGNKIIPGYEVCVDNEVFGDKFPGNEIFLAFVEHVVSLGNNCWFAVAPDVVGEAAATLLRSAPMLDRIRKAGTKVAVAAQNGLTPVEQGERLADGRIADADGVTAGGVMLPWSAFDVLFLGGGPECVRCDYIRPVRMYEQKKCPHCDRRLIEWKESAAAAALVKAALLHGLTAHMGRVSSLRRTVIAYLMGCSSADGTYLTHGPDKNLPKLLGWLDDVNTDALPLRLAS